LQQAPVPEAWPPEMMRKKEAPVGLVDKVKEQAEHAGRVAQQGLSQGQAKYDQLQAKRQSQALFRRLGEAYYAQQRQQGSAEAVTAALAALDAHVAAQAEKESATATNGSAEADTGAATSGPVPPAGVELPSSDAQ
jgi:hypothetical protein